eukprot:1140952-Pelagomonas_calceolata.AAC.5
MHALTKQNKIPECQAFRSTKTQAFGVIMCARACFGGGNKCISSRSAGMISMHIVPRSTYKGGAVTVVYTAPDFSVKLTLNCEQNHSFPRAWLGITTFAQNKEGRAYL